MEDLLSLDDDVLNEVFPKTPPRVRRLPSVRWMRLKRDIRDFLVEKESEGNLYIKLKYINDNIYQIFSSKTYIFVRRLHALYWLRFKCNICYFLEKKDSESN